ncbi:MAG: hypothetical protein UV73_C0007G0025 [Candidatus Gottesmanbacteria bacterium GW2011_GWA2_43_14]|uniref:SpoVT-AbrB domain-containing protein n=1 Tax=Candidatus Gottesmanbacteria bacterium GW2011_GWA2_43_14 TaxID=1618443 RepID=A0A0G1DJ14_9BACT|nr:MAG: hypothetical protein UV73_C0007G0025 [Candidatus Gottesmanbacteria bacterium GW2011_GWA2_43_14]
MIHYVTITSQGQITIPAKLRRKFNFGKNKKAIVSYTENGILVEPVKDILEFEGIFKTDKKIPFKKARKAFVEYLASRSSRISK